MHSVRYYYEMKKALRGDANTARASCSKAEPKIFAPSQTPFPGAQDGQNLISWRCKIITRYLTRGGALYLSLYLQTQFGEDRCTQFRVIVVTDPPTHTHTHKQTGPITIHRAAASAQCNSSFKSDGLGSRDAWLRFRSATGLCRPTPSIQSY